MRAIANGKPHACSGRASLRLACLSRLMLGPKLLPWTGYRHNFTDLEYCGRSARVLNKKAEFQCLQTRFAPAQKFAPGLMN